MVEFKTFINASAKTNAGKVADWINASKFCRNQLVSICMCMDSTEPGSDSIFTVWYRTNSIVSSEVPMRKINVKEFPSTKSWDDLYDEA